jgi:hypothetical protein
MMPSRLPTASRSMLEAALPILEKLLKCWLCLLPACQHLSQMIASPKALASCLGSCGLTTAL